MCVINVPRRGLLCVNQINLCESCEINVQLLCVVQNYFHKLHNNLAIHYQFHTRLNEISCK